MKQYHSSPNRRDSLSHASTPAWKYVLADGGDEHLDQIGSIQHHQGPLFSPTTHSDASPSSVDASSPTAAHTQAKHSPKRPPPLSIDSGGGGIQGRTSSPKGSNASVSTHQFRSAIGFNVNSATSSASNASSPISYSPSAAGNSPIHTRTTIATRMKQQLSRNSLIRQPSASKLYRYQQMRDTIQKAIDEHNLVAALPSKDVESGQQTPPYIKQINLSMYSDENLSRRERLRTNAKIHEQLEVWWQRIKKERNQLTDDEFISQKIYVSLSMAIYYVLMMMDSNKSRVIPLKQNPSVAHQQQPVTLMDARKCAEQDWINDAKGATLLNKDEFMDSVFSLADLWCESIHVSEYVEFLDRLSKRVFDDSTLPLIMRRHVKRTPASAARSTSPRSRSTKKKATRKRRRPPPPKVDWSVVKRTGLDLTSEGGSESPSPRSLRTPREWGQSENNFMTEDQDFDGNQKGEKVQEENVLRGDQQQRAKSPVRSVTPEQVSHIVARRKIPVVKRKPIIHLKSSELRQILQYLRNKEALKLVMALLNQGDQYVLEKTIFDRLLRKLKSGFATNLNSSLFQLMDQNIIPERYQSIMSRLNKLNPEQFVTVLREAMDQKHKSHSDKIVLDMNDVAPSYKRARKRPISAPSTKIGATMPRREVILTRRLLRTVSAKPASQNQRSQEIVPSPIQSTSTIRPSSVLSSRKSAKAKWNSWKDMIRSGMQFNKDIETEGHQEPCEDQVDSQDGLSEREDESLLHQDAGIDGEFTQHDLKNAPNLESNARLRGETGSKPESISDDDDDYSMFSELSDPSEEMSLWSMSTTSKMDEDVQEGSQQHDIKSQQEKESHPVKIFRVKDVAKIRSIFNAHSPNAAIADKRSSWLPTKGFIYRSTRSTIAQHPQESNEASLPVESTDNASTDPTVPTEMQLPAGASTLSPIDSVVFLNDLGSTVPTRRRSSQHSSLVPLRSARRDSRSTHDGGWKTAPSSRPTSAGIRVRVTKRPQSSKLTTSRWSLVTPFKRSMSDQQPKQQGPLRQSRPSSANFSHLSTAEVVYDARIGSPSFEARSSAPRRP